MKKRFLNISLAILLSTILFSFKNNDIRYTISSDYSNVVWFLSSHDYIHSGSMKVKDGYIVVKNGQISEGKINIDAGSIINTDIKDLNNKNEFVNFLKSSNFLDVNRYPIITIDILSSHPTTDNQCLLKTNLTIKNKTVPVEFSTMIKNQTNKAILIETCKVHLAKENFDLLPNSSRIPASLQKNITTNANFELEISQLVGVNNAK